MILLFRRDRGLPGDHSYEIFMGSNSVHITIWHSSLPGISLPWVLKETAVSPAAAGLLATATLAPGSSPD